jgi:hypothetical protein
MHISNIYISIIKNGIHICIIKIWNYILIIEIWIHIDINKIRIDIGIYYIWIHIGIIEIWIYIDFQVNPPKTGDYFFDSSNVAKVYFSKNLMYFELFTQRKYLSIYNVSSPFKQYEWNKFIISVKQTNSKTLESYFFLNNDFKNPIVNYTGVSYLDSYILSYIKFSNKFGSAYYKNLRILDG